MGRRYTPSQNGQFSREWSLSERALELGGWIGARGAEAKARRDTTNPIRKAYYVRGGARGRTRPGGRSGTYTTPPDDMHRWWWPALTARARRRVGRNSTQPPAIAGTYVRCVHEPGGGENHLKTVRHQRDGFNGEGNLCEPYSGERTPLGRAYSYSYSADLRVATARPRPDCLDLSALQLTIFNCL